MRERTHNRWKSVLTCRVCPFLFLSQWWRIIRQLGKLLKCVIISNVKINRPQKLAIHDWEQSVCVGKEWYNSNANEYEKVSLWHIQLTIEQHRLELCGFLFFNDIWSAPGSLGITCVCSTNCRLERVFVAHGWESPEVRRWANFMYFSTPLYMKGLSIHKLCYPQGSETNLQ